MSTRERGKEETRVQELRNLGAKRGSGLKAMERQRAMASMVAVELCFDGEIRSEHAWGRELGQRRRREDAKWGRYLRVRWHG